jgi:hypothetical protein
MAALVERHEGRIVNTWGDAVIAEFTSVVEAVQCAIETQQELSTQDPHPSKTAVPSGTTSVTRACKSPRAARTKRTSRLP